MARTFEATFRPKAIRAGGWENVPALACPDLGDLVLWPDMPWHRKVNDDAVDHLRTAMLEQVDVDVRCRSTFRDNVRSGTPYQRVDGVKATKVWPVRLFDGLGQKLPLPPVVTRFGDPTGSQGDLQWIAIDVKRTLLYEASSLGVSWRGWQASSVRVSNYSRPFAESKSITACKIPMLALLPRPERLLDGYIPHALAMTGPASPRFRYPARNSDGTVEDHPLEHGDRLRLRADIADARLAVEPDPVNRAVITAERDYGLFFTDTTGPDNNTRLPMDPRITINVAGLRLTDYEVLR